MMKLFDRSVDLAQFNDKTPLYPIARSWMKDNNPETVEENVTINEEVTVLFNAVFVDVNIIIISPTHPLQNNVGCCSFCVFYRYRDQPVCLSVSLSLCLCLCLSVSVCLSVSTSLLDETKSQLQYTT